MTAVYSTKQIATARTIFEFWKSKGVTEIVAASFVADADRECSLSVSAEGDKVNGVPTAFGLAQDHMARVKSIRGGTGIDMRAASVADQCAGIFWEISKGPYKAILPALKACPTLWGVNAILISRFEQSADQARDLGRQVPMAEHWLATFGARS